MISKPLTGMTGRRFFSSRKENQGDGPGFLSAPVFSKLKNRGAMLHGLLCGKRDLNPHENTFTRSLV